MVQVQKNCVQVEELQKDDNGIVPQRWVCWSIHKHNKTFWLACCVVCGHAVYYVGGWLRSKRGNGEEKKREKILEIWEGVGRM